MEERRHGRRHVLVKDISPARRVRSPALTNVGGTLYFPTADRRRTAAELWKSDGTAAGTALVEDIDPGTARLEPRDSTNVNGTLFFAADDGITRAELWRSDGTAAGTILVKDISTNTYGSSPGRLWLEP